MDDAKGRHQMDFYKGMHPPWNLPPQHQAKTANALDLNRKIMAILEDKNNAVKERNAAVEETKEALWARDEAIKQTNQAYAERDKALIERDNARAALQYMENAINNHATVGNQQRRAKRANQSLISPSYLHSHPSQVDMPEAYIDTNEAHQQATDGSSGKLGGTKCTKQNKGNSTRGSKGKKVGEDLNIWAPPTERRIRSKWDNRDEGLNLVNYNGSIMSVPVCSCTGVPRHCYKWGNGGWQSSCCTMTISMYPLPQIPNKRHSRLGGRKMSGSVFLKLLSRMAEEGHDLSAPLDLKDYWAKHGTNRYITIK
ncbi:hypothetical protein SAY86_025634 [Trapa natans]|uniref:GAGA-binding transcriptional activator n=1 Tax=Trapa natans TaxID=22666 RepID=A0AAN7KCE5_TRANT|nr:hypothetical protein SAY86_025634 [Trapa natans]